MTQANLSFLKGLPARGILIARPPTESLRELPETWLFGVINISRERAGVLFAERMDGKRGLRLPSECSPGNANLFVLRITGRGL